MSSRLLVGASLAILLVLPAVAQANDFVRAECRDGVTTAPAAFETPEHQRWYKRFWTGECDQLKRCIPGAPHWNSMIGKLLVRGAPSERATLQPKACRLGRLIGLEWSRSKKIRRIDLDDLRDFNRMLEASPDPLQGVEKVEAAVRARLAR